MGIALVFGGYYIWLGVGEFIATSGIGGVATTSTAQEEATATAQEVTVQALAFTPLPTNTPMPTCQDFTVIVESAIIRASPNTAAAILDTAERGETVCVLEKPANSDWYRIDRNPATRRIEEAFMHEDLLEALNPTLTPSRTFTPAPTVTPMPSATRTLSPTPRPTNTPDPDATDTPTATPPPSPTFNFQSA
ncbi:MAG: hypothetical protein OHK0046_49970 [Anaerolineae bacterium]